MTAATDATTARGPVPTGARAVGVLPRIPRQQGPGPLPHNGSGRPVFAAGLAVVCVAAALLRLDGLTRLGFTSDEAVYARQGRVLLASLLGAPPADGWTAVRAHPPLLGLLAAALPGGPRDDLGPRLLVVGFAVLTVALTGLLGRRVAGPGAGLLAAGVVAVLPYHVDVSRLVLVDVPMAALTTAALVTAVRWLASPRPALLVATAALLGVATLFKETAVLTTAAVVVVLAGVAARRSGRAGGRRSGAVAAVAVHLGIVLTYPLLLLASGGLGRAQEYVGWQLVRAANDGPAFYLDDVAGRFGVVALVAGAVGAVLLARTDRATGALLGAAVVVPAAFYLLWPTKGYPYPAALVPPFAVLAGCALDRGVRAVVDAVERRPGHRPGRRTAVVTLLLGAAVLAAVPGTARAEAPPVASSTGVPGLRETALWLRAQPAGPVLTASQGVANVLRYYSDRHVEALADGRRPGALNPAYRPTGATGTVPVDALEPRTRTYLVWDTWTRTHDAQASQRLVALVRAHRARVAHVETGPSNGAGDTVSPLVVVFEVGS